MENSQHVISLVTLDDIINVTILIFYIIFIGLLVVHCEFQNMRDEIEKMKKDVEEPTEQKIEDSSSETDEREANNIEDIIEEIKRRATKKEKRLIISYLEKIIVDYTMEHEDLIELEDSSYKHKTNALKKLLILFERISDKFQKKTKTD